MADLSPTRGREQSGRRPVVLVSPESFNRGAAELTIICPLTTRDRKVRTHLRVQPPEGGLKEPSFIMSEAVRSISKDRLIAYWGSLDRQTVAQMDDVLRILLDL
jgi:mRNA interferase MazF